MALHLLANRRQIDLEAMWIPRNLPQIFRIKDLITASDKDGTTSLPPSPYYEPLLLFSFLGVWNITVFRLNNKKKMGMAVTKKIPPLNIVMLLFIVVRLLSQVQPSATTWTAACQASLSITISQSLPQLMSIESVMPSNHLILCHPLLLLPSIFPSIRVFPMSQLFASGGQSIGSSASASVLPKNTQNWSPFRWTGWISLQSKGLSRVFSNTTVQKHQFFSAQISL